MRRKRASTGKRDDAPKGEEGRAQLLFPGEHGGKVGRWNVAIKKAFNAGDTLAKCLCRVAKGDERMPNIDLVAPYDGTLLQVLAPEGQSIPPVLQGDEESQKKQAVARISYCKHDIILPGFGLCGVCGRVPSQASSMQIDNNSKMQDEEKLGGGASLVDASQATSATMTLNLADGAKIVVSRAEAQDERKSTIKRLIASRKLSLVLDIDHTMLHAVDDGRAPEFAKRKGLENALHTFKLACHNGYTDVDKPHYCVLRPGLETWLKQLSTMYELYIYTAGTRVYAEAVAKIFDPTGKLFGKRIISRTDVPELGKIKRLDRFFPVDNNMVLAVDDRSDVWAEDTSNLITIRPYHFFKGMADINNSSGPEFDLKNEAAAEERDEKHRKHMDHGLRRVFELLSWIHKKFYEKKADANLDKQVHGKGEDVKALVKKLRARILRGEFRVLVDTAVGSREQRRLTELAHSCGAVCVDSIDTKNISVVVSTDANSPVSQKAKARALWVVHPDWLQACVHNWNKEPFQHYTMFGLRQQSGGNSNEGTAANKRKIEVKGNGNGEKVANGKRDEGIPTGKPPPAKKQKFVEVDDFGYPLEDSDDEEEDEDAAAAAFAASFMK